MSAVFDSGKQQLLVTFDRLLQAGTLEERNWSWRFGSALYTAVGAVAVDDAVMLNGAPAGVQFGNDVVNYSPPPFDVVSSAGKAAKAFGDFPVV